MYQVATPIWNEIARTRLKTAWARALFAMSQDEMTLELEALGDYLEQAGAPNKVILAYQQMAPLLVENEAISRYIIETANLNLRLGLPEVLTVDEALHYSILEWNLDQSQVKICANLLRNIKESAGRLSSLVRQTSAESMKRSVLGLVRED